MNEEYGKILNCAEIKVTLLVIMHTIVPINLHFELNVTPGHAHLAKIICACVRSAFPIQSCILNLKSLPQGSSSFEDIFANFELRFNNHKLVF